MNTFHLEALWSLPASMEIHNFQKIHIIFYAIDSFQAISVRCFENHNVQVCLIIFFLSRESNALERSKNTSMRSLSHQMLNMYFPIEWEAIVWLNILAWIQIESYWSSCAFPIDLSFANSKLFLILYSRMKESNSVDNY